MNEVRMKNGLKHNGMPRSWCLWILVVVAMGGLFVLYGRARQSLPLSFLHVPAQATPPGVAGSGADMFLRDRGRTGNETGPGVTRNPYDDADESAPSHGVDLSAVGSHGGSPEVSPVHSGLSTCGAVTRNIYYAKVHKTASSTMITVLYNVARTYNLTVYPVASDPYPGAMDRTPFQKPQGYHDMVYNIFGEHAVFKADVADRVMPLDTRYIATIREPLAQLRSMFVEFAVRLIDSRGHKLSSPESAELFLNNPERYGRGRHMNFQATVLGHKPPESGVDFIKRVEARFSVIIVAEYFDESVLYLRREFCWTFRDVVYTVLRQRTYKNKETPPTELQMSNHRQYSPVDYQMYEYFVQKLLSNTVQRSQTFMDELRVFKEIKDRVSEFCTAVINKIRINTLGIKKMIDDNEHSTFDPSPFGEPFAVSAVDCALMKLRTRVHRNLMYIRQFPRLCEKSPKYTPVIHKTFSWYGERVEMHRAYCGPRDANGIVTGVLEVRDAYMWT